MPDPVPHEKVVQIAENYRELELLRKKQAATQATMIRACLQRIQRKPGAFDIAESRKIERERREAFAGLEQLAAMLEKQGGTDA